jgi:hypothetical protein
MHFKLASRVKHLLISLHKYISTTLDNESRDIIKSNRFRWSQALNGFITFESETDAKVKNSEDDKRFGKTAGQGLLYID